jgi:hypothetical protein
MVAAACTMSSQPRARILQAGRGKLLCYTNRRHAAESPAPGDRAGLSPRGLSGGETRGQRYTLPHASHHAFDLCQMGPGQPLRSKDCRRRLGHPGKVAIPCSDDSPSVSPARDGSSVYPTSETSAAPFPLGRPIFRRVQACRGVASPKNVGCLRAIVRGNVCAGPTLTVGEMRHRLGPTG